jgi:hypothetical protein
LPAHRGEVAYELSVERSHLRISFGESLRAFFWIRLIVLFARCMTRSTMPAIAQYE